MATLLPQGKQVFFDANGAPLAGGFVYHYIPGTTTAKDTWRDAGQTILNPNPIILDANGSAVIYGSGAYRQVVTDPADVTIWDQLTADTASSGSSWAGQSAGSANAQTVTAANFTSADGQGISFIAGYTNTGATTLNPSGIGPIAVLKDTPSGAVLLTGGEIVAGCLVSVTYDATRGAFHLGSYAQSNLSVSEISTSRLTLTGTAVASGVISAALSVDTADWSPIGLSGATRIRITASAAVNLSGIASASDGRVLILENVGSNTVTITANDTSSLAVNRFVIPRPRSLRPLEAVMLVYDGSKAGWMAAGVESASPCTGQSHGLSITVSSNTLATLAASELIVGETLGGRARLTGVSVNIATGSTGAGGLDAGTVANSTWYAVYVIYNPSTRAVAGLFSTSATTPALPSGYTHFARFGWVVTDSSGLLKRTKQLGLDAQYVLTAGTNTTALPTISSGAQASWQSVAVSGFAPATATMINAVVSAASLQSTALAPNTVYMADLTAPRPPLYTKAGVPGAYIDLNASTGAFLIEGANIYYAGGSNSVASCIGWRDAG